MAKGYQMRISEGEAAKRIKEKSGGLLDYVSGYTVKEKPVRVRCLLCGGEFERTYHNITTKGSVTCPHCVKRARNKRKEQRTEEQRRAREDRKEKTKRRHEEEAEHKREARRHPCLVCGEMTYNPKYCCFKCQSKANNSAKENRRRAKLDAAMVDKDITLESLFRRDNGVCSLCGRKCNYEDYVVRDGAFIAGDWYPSIDHVRPLSKGGVHSWDNVQLAHRRCNYLKGDTIKG